MGNQDNYMRKDFWGFVKNVLERGSYVLPSFTRDHCTKFFIKIFSTVRPFQTFSIPSWIPKFSEPSTPFDLSPPTYQKVTRVIRRTKSSGSPCLLDKLSIICFKRCPYLRSILTEVIRVVWESLQVPTEWKKACTVLAHKKGSNDDPSNFRPITLESVPLKVFTSCLRDSIFTFLKENNFIEVEIQKA